MCEACQFRRPFDGCEQAFTTVKSWGTTAQAQPAEKILADVPCQNCGKMVKTWLPFYGCIFCGDCSSARDWTWSASTEDFFDPKGETL